MKRNLAAEEDAAESAAKKAKVAADLSSSSSSSTNRTDLSSSTKSSSSANSSSAISDAPDDPSELLNIAIRQGDAEQLERALAAGASANGTIDVSAGEFDIGKAGQSYSDITPSNALTTSHCCITSFQTYSHHLQ